ncbi:MAG: ATP-binding protein [Mycobacterium sp.]|nr:ATP-binding protein [Mycobacterium sp.]
MSANGPDRAGPATTPVGATPGPEPDPTSPLWRAAQVFRLLSFGYALGFQVVSNAELDRPILAWLLFAALSVWTAVCAVAYLRGFGRRAAWVVAEFAVVAVLVLSTRLVASPQWIADNQSLPTTLWATNATISAAIQLGPVLGMVTGLAVIALYVPLKGAVSFDLARNASLVIELAVGLAVGLAAGTARRAHDELLRALRLSAAVAERENLARQVHDGVLQVLALVAKRGREIGGPTADLAELAGEQERALRRLISIAGGDTGTDPATVDLAELLRARAGDRVVVSVPGPAVPMDAVRAAELDAAVVNILDNVVAHAGPGATAYVLLEDLEDTVAVSIRDDGVGIAPQRLAQAAAEGRMGIAKSVVGRLQALSGTAQVNSEPGAGTEWELTVPRQPSRGRTHG